MKRLILLFLLIPSVAWGAPDTLMSITPAAADATVITASDVNTRNTNISTPYNAHGHSDITQVGNTLKLGDGTAGNKTIQANNADGTKPFLRYDDTNDRWVLSRDGVEITSIVVVTGPTGNKFILPESPSNGNHLIYRSITDSWSAETLDTSSIQDSDGNTKIDTEESSDENIIRMDTAGTERWIMTAAGERTMPTQPAFLVEPASGQMNIAVGSEIDIIWGTEITDQSDDFASNNFTAPVTGNYQLNVYISLSSIDTAATEYFIKLVTSNRTYTFASFTPGFSADANFPFTFSVLADMDANDTAKVTIEQTAGTQQTDITADSKFSGFLAN